MNFFHKCFQEVGAALLDLLPNGRSFSSAVRRAGILPAFLTSPIRIAATRKYPATTPLRHL
jgi:hypothetical protein